MKRPSLLISFSFLVIAFLIVMNFLFSCKKEKNGADLFHGKWKTSYNDTIEFASVNGENRLIADLDMNPAQPATNTREYVYRNGKLGVSIGASPINGFYMYDSFRWIERGREFEVLGMQWFPFISSSTTVFTFTKIQ